MTEARAIIFDFNGVILDDETWHYQSLSAVLKEEGLALTRARYDSDYLGVDDEDCFRRAWLGVGRPEPAPDASRALVARKAEKYMGLAEAGWRLFPGIVETVERLAREIPLAINSGALREEIRVVLDAFGMNDCFRVIVAGDEHPRSKPHPEGYLLALEGLRRELGLSEQELAAGRCLAIEDAPNGLRAARAAGMRAIGVTTSCEASLLTDLADLVLPGVEGLSVGSLETLLGSW